MSELESVGSSDYQVNATDQSLTDPDYPASQLAASFEKVAAQIVSREPFAHQTALKMLLALMSKGYDVSEFSAFVVQEIGSPDAASRDLANVFLSHYAVDCPDTAILAVNSLQRALTDYDPIIRARAIMTISSLKIREVLPQISDAVNQVIGDPSPYVKKAAAFAMVKACELEPNDIESYLPLIERLLADRSPIAFSGAIAAYWMLCPDNIELLHPHFRYICQNIQSFDSYAQCFILRSLTPYSRYCFKQPTISDEGEGDANFWDEESPKDLMTADHIAVIHAAKRLLSSPNSSVVLAAAAFLFYCAPSVHINAIARPLIRLLFDAPLVSVVSLTTILTIATTHAHIFLPHLGHFYVRSLDSDAVRLLKLRVLCALASPDNTDAIFRELSL
jgi:AP-3 complex subunit beta